jgi:heme exporter protein CcmD
MRMINWLDNPQNVYVLAAYGITALGLFGLLFVSWRDERKTKSRRER